ncbi:hypothetical protein Cantr_03693 [Candida viswanathii]|uniref:Hap4 transcription factor heteromerisation domain-containing protein n=1 Tax=Candida viswanathii TaxID=5486 RepID=A0A367XNA0_9ASCO|nr:hypothetical protein Cantr_03693 [Candida viswanathii]
MNTPPIEKDKPPPPQPQLELQQQQQPLLGKSLPITPKPAQPSHPSGSGITTPSKILPTNKQPPQPLLKQQPHPHPHPKQQPMKPVLHPQGNNKQTLQSIKPRPAMHPIAPKYHKIQPAIAPKPIASANNKNASSQPSKFNPIPTGKLSLLMNLLTLAKNASNNGKDCSSLNTSRKWVLPPRPRPGRKPTHEAGATPENEKKTKGNGTSVTKKKPKCKKEPVPAVTPDLLSTPSPSTTGTPTLSKSLSSTPSDSKKSSSVSSSAATPAIPENASTSDQQLPDIPIPTIDVDPKTQLLEMKMSYLSKLKEQELIRNYIEILTNQIKELGFIQNGVITFDALKSNMKYNKIPSTVASTSSTNARYDQLEAINNLNDLNKYLNYLTKSSNIINSVKKKNVIEGPDGDSIDHQIDHYLEIRNKFKSVKKMDVLNFKNFNQLGIPVQANTPSPIIENSPANSDIFKNNDITSIFSGTTFQDDMNADPDKFVPDLLKPIKASNLFLDLQQQHSQAAQLQLQPSQDTDLQIQTETIEESISSTSILSNSSIPPTSTTSNIAGGDSLNKFLDDDYDNIDGFFMDEHDFLNRLVLNDNVNMDQDQEQDVFGSVEIHGSSSSNNNNTTTTNNNDNVNGKNNGSGNEMMIKKKKLKLNCGFCTNDTPCLCFDTLSPDK